MPEGRTFGVKATCCGIIVTIVCQVAAAWGFSLDLPVDCTLGDDCLVFQYFDQDPTPSRRDYACGWRTYDGHMGTDFRAMTLNDMARGVPVVAAAAGEVRAVRDGIDDVDYDTLPEGAVEGREAGNVVVIEHPGGYETQYSHLRKGSIVVRPGQKVAAGQRLGLIGMSGMAAFPHVEFGVRRNREPIDPYTGGGPGTARDDCRMGPGTLWSPTAQRALAYRETDIMGAGFAPLRPTMADVEQGMRVYRRIRSDARVFTLWVWLGGTRDGDVLYSLIKLPDGRVMSESERPIEGYKVQYLAFTGARLADGRRWPSGKYTGVSEIRRTDESGVVRAVARAVRSVIVP